MCACVCVREREGSRQAGRQRKGVAPVVIDTASENSLSLQW